MNIDEIAEQPPGLVRQAFTLYRKNLLSFVPLALVLTIAASALAGVGFRLSPLYRSLDDPTNDSETLLDALLAPATSKTYWLLAVSEIVTTVLYVLAIAAAVVITRQLLEKEVPKWRAAVIEALRWFPTLAAFAFALVGMRLLQRYSPNSWAWLAGPILVYLELAFTLVTPIVIMRGVAFPSALEESRRLAHAGSLFNTAVVRLLQIFVQLLTIVVVVATITAPGAFIVGATELNSTTVLVIAVVAAELGRSLALPFDGILYTLMFHRWNVQRERLDQERLNADN